MTAREALAETARRLAAAGIDTADWEARQLVSQKGVRVDGTVASEDTKVPVNGEPLVQIGKRKAVRVRFR